MVIKSQKGAALVMALLIGLLGTVIGTTLYTVSNVNAKQVQQRAYQLQADYLAESGVKMALGIIANNGSDYLADGEETTFWGTLDDGLTDQDPADDSYTIKVAISFDASKDSYIIGSTGYMRGTGQGAGGVSIAQSSSIGNAYYQISRDAVVEYISEVNSGSNGSGNSNNSGGGQAPSLDKIFAVGVNPSDGKAVELTGSSSIYGDVGVNSVAQNSVDFSSGNTCIYNGDLYIGPNGDPNTVVLYPKSWRKASTVIPNGSIKNLTSIQSFALPTFPEFPSYTPIQSMDAGWWPIPSGGFQISQSGQYSSINVTNQLTINIGNQDVIIRTGSLSVTGSGQIILNRAGTGKLILYVDNGFTLSGSSKINNNGDYNSLVMYYAGTNPIDVGGSTKFVGSVYAKTANVSIEGSGGITGHIVTGGKTVKVQGSASANVRAFYAPLASLEVTGSGSIRGAVVANDIKVQGSSSITYDDSLDTTFFDQLEWESTGTNEEPPVDLVSHFGLWLKDDK